MYCVCTRDIDSMLYALPTKSHSVPKSRGSAHQSAGISFQDILGALSLGGRRRGGPASYPLRGGVPYLARNQVLA
jgi:hypothetical protein